MASPFIGEIRLFGGNFNPVGWAKCDGQLMVIAQNDVLFNLIGTTYGGDGQNTFALPDLRSRVPVHQGSSLGNSYVLGQAGGAEAVTLTINETPAHAHVALASSAGATTPFPAGGVWAVMSQPGYAPGAGANATMNAASLGGAGGSQPHENMLPFLAVNFIISLFGVFPSPN